MEKVKNLLKNILNKQIKYTSAKHSELCQKPDNSLSLDDSKNIILPVDDGDFEQLKNAIMKLPAVATLGYMTRTGIKLLLTKEKFDKLIQKALVESWKDIADICLCKQQQQQQPEPEPKQQQQQQPKQQQPEPEPKPEPKQQQQQQPEQQQQQPEQLRPKSLTEQDIRNMLPDMTDAEWIVYKQGKGTTNIRNVAEELISRRLTHVNPFKKTFGQFGGFCSTEIDRLKEEIVENMIKRIEDKVVKLLPKSGGRYRVTRFKLLKTATVSKTKKNKYRKHKRTKKNNCRSRLRKYKNKNISK